MGLCVLASVSRASLLSLPLAFLLVVILGVGACLGHLALMIISHNWWYGQALPRHTGKIIHLSHGLLILALPVGLVWAYGWDLAGLPPLSTELAWPQLVTMYVVFCAFLGFVALPLNTIRRLLRRDPTVEIRSRVLDVAKHLGRRPVGTSKERLLAHLPGNEVFQV